MDKVVFKVAPSLSLNFKTKEGGGLTPPKAKTTKSEKSKVGNSLLDSNISTDKQRKTEISRFHSTGTNHREPTSFKQEKSGLKDGSSVKLFRAIAKLNNTKASRSTASVRTAKLDRIATQKFKERANAESQKVPLPPGLFPNSASTFVKRRFAESIENAKGIVKDTGKDKIQNKVQDIAERKIQEKVEPDEGAKTPLDKERKSLVKGKDESLIFTRSERRDGVTLPASVSSAFLLPQSVYAEFDDIDENEGKKFEENQNSYEHNANASVSAQSKADSSKMYHGGSDIAISSSNSFLQPVSEDQYLSFKGQHQEYLNSDIKSILRSSSHSKEVKAIEYESNSSVLGMGESFTQVTIEDDSDYNSEESELDESYYTKNENSGSSNTLGEHCSEASIREETLYTRNQSNDCFLENDAETASVSTDVSISTSNSPSVVEGGNSHDSKHEQSEFLEVKNKTAAQNLQKKRSKEGLKKVKTSGKQSTLKAPMVKKVERLKKKRTSTKPGDRGLNIENMSKSLQRRLKDEFLLTISSNTREKWSGVLNLGANCTIENSQGFRPNIDSSFSKVDHSLLYESAKALKGSILDEMATNFEEGLRMANDFSQIGRISSALHLFHLLIAKFPQQQKVSYYERIKIYADLGWWSKVIEDSVAILQIDRNERQARFSLVQGLIRQKSAPSSDSIIFCLKQLDYVVTINPTSTTLDKVQAYLMMCELRSLLAKISFCKKGNLKDYLLSAFEDITNAIIACENSKAVIGKPIRTSLKILCYQKRGQLAAELARLGFVNMGKCKEVIRQDYLECLKLSTSQEISVSKTADLQTILVAQLIDFFIDIQEHKGAVDLLREIESILTERENRKESKLIQQKTAGDIFGASQFKRRTTVRNMKKSKLEKRDTKANLLTRSKSKFNAAGNNELKRGSTSNDIIKSTISAQGKSQSRFKDIVNKVNLKKGNSATVMKGKSAVSLLGKSRLQGDVIQIQTARVQLCMLFTQAGNTRTIEDLNSNSKEFGTAFKTLSSLFSGSVGKLSYATLRIGAVYYARMLISLQKYSECLRILTLSLAGNKYMSSTTSKRKSMEEEKVSVWLRCMRAYVYAKLGQPTKAADDLKLISERTAGMSFPCSESLVFLCLIQLDQLFNPSGAIQSARDALEIAMREIPEKRKYEFVMSNALKLCAKAYIDVGGSSITEVVNLCSRNLYLDPNQPWLYLLRSRLLFRSKRYISALYDALLYLKLDGSLDGESNITTKAEILRILQRGKEAYDLVITSHIKNPTFDNLNLLCELVHDSNNNVKEKEENIRTFIDEIRENNSKSISNHGSTKTDNKPDLYMALSLHSIGALDDSIIYYERALAINPKCTQSLNGRGTCHIQKILAKKRNQDILLTTKKKFSLEEFMIGLIDFESILKLEPEYIDAYLNIAIVYKICGEYRSAIEALEQVLILEPQNIEALTNKSVLLHLIGSTAAAIQVTDQALKVATADDEFSEAAISKKLLWYNSGTLYISIMDKNHALESLNKALEFDDEFLPALINRGVLYHMYFDDPMAALEDFLRVQNLIESASFPVPIGLINEKDRIFLSIGNCLFKVGRLHDACLHFKMASESRFYAGAMIGIAAVDLQTIFSKDIRNEDVEALKQVATSIKEYIRSHGPGCVPAYINLGHALQCLDQCEDALRCYNSAIILLRQREDDNSNKKRGTVKSIYTTKNTAINETFSEDAFIGSILALLRHGEVSAAFRQVSARIKFQNGKNSTSLRVEKVWALVNHASGNCSIAYEKYRSILSIQRNTIRRCNKIAEGINRKSFAGGHVRPGILFQNDILLLLSTLCLRLRRPKEALTYTNNILEDHPENTGALLNQGISWMVLGRQDVALDSISKVLRLVEAVQHRFGQRTDGERHVVAISKIPDSRLYFNRAVIQVALGKYDSAKNDCDEAIELDPTNSELYRFRAEIYTAEFLKKEAMSDIHSAFELERTAKERNFNKQELV